ncbi:TetR/AcrR family transcriptional regulator [Planomonospora sp. ID67723]|uniref:TetR/AcrR family transcriptional regulator n=1 Tax=Planomonospora sp. ID67723 TaxID=2738134 RepID=UPI0018C415A3|nr:TetR/AcrR family transcriptional regulator [Planomonospora sp. ID67723]
MTSRRRRLSAHDWAEAALEALGTGGVAAVAIEPLAVRLGTTKGSFYAHYANREALVSAALTLWEQRSTEAAISTLETEPDPEARLRRLLTQAARRAGQNLSETNIMASAGHEPVAAVVRRVMQRRVQYLVSLFEQVGFPRTEAVHRAALAHTAYVGLIEMMARLPGALPIDSPGATAGYVESVVALLLHRTGGGDPQEKPEGLLP